MLDRTASDVANSDLTGKQIGHRPLLFAALAAATTAAMLWLAATALSPGGLGIVDVALLALFALTLPWTVIGFWNSVIGFAVMRFATDPASAIMPGAARVRGDKPITAATAILLCIRNEVPARAILNLQPMLDGLTASGAAERFHLFVLSDTDVAIIAAAEERAFAALIAKWRDRLAITYRRRENNTGFKAGNIRDFCEQWGADFEFAITLDADSVMPADAMLGMVRIMQADPTLGILQGLVVGLPSTSAFARLFQFGMRLGMRSYTVGAAWWQGDSGPYWGHNAVLRLKPFIAHCTLPRLGDEPGAERHVLSHDQIEAALMRRAGYAVRVLAREDLGWEENPKSLPEFIRRDLRWCEGNLQYGPLLLLPGLTAVSRYHIVFAMLMFLSSPAWIGLLVVGTLALALRPVPTALISPEAGLALFGLTVLMWQAPKIATAIDVLTRPLLRISFGGAARFLASVVSEMVFFTLLCPIMWFSHALFMSGLPFGRSVGWIGQTRDDHIVPWNAAVRDLWPHTLLGIAVVAILAVTYPAAIPYALVLAGGPALAIPLAVLTATPGLGLAMARSGIGRLPEESDPPAVLRALALPAVAAAQPPVPPP